MKQPLLGIVATAIIIAISWLAIFLLGVDLFMNWASFAIMGAIPFAIVTGAFWHSSVPAAIGRMKQPAKGLCYLVLAVIAAAIVTLVHWLWRGGGAEQPIPMAVMTIITSVVTMFFLAIAFGGWPFSLVRNKFLGGVLLWVSAYVINAIIFQVFFNFEFAAGAPFYQPGLDPGGLLNAWDVVVVMVTALSVMFLFLNFDVWPLTGVKALRSQPLLGLVWTVLCFVIGWFVFWLGTAVAGMPAPVFMVQVSIPFLFGSIVMLNMLGGSVFGNLSQPLKGLLTAIASAVVGKLLALLYAAMMPVLSGPLGAGPDSDFAAELWLANALLAMTFPLLAFFGDFFGLWPLAKQQPAAEAAPAEVAAEEG